MLSVESMICGYHEYMCIWENPSIEDHMFCEREIGNPYDTHAVAIKGSITEDATGTVTTVGDVPRKICAMCSIFIRRGGTIICVVNGVCCYSADLPQGGLEIPCILKFMTKNQSEVAKTECFLISSLNVTSTGVSEDVQIASSGKSSDKSHSDVVKDHAVAEVNDAVPESEPRPIVDLTESSSTGSPPARKQKTFDKEKNIMGEELSDDEINYAQQLLKTKYS